MTTLNKVTLLSLIIAAQAFMMSIGARAAECAVDEAKVASLAANKESLQGLIDEIRSEKDLDKRYSLLQQHLSALVEQVAAMDSTYKSLIEECGSMSSSREDAIIRLLEQRINLLQLVVSHLVEYEVEYQSPYMQRGRPW